MNSTNRFLNRLLVFVVGLVLLLAGAAVAVGALLPDVQKPVTQGADDVRTPVSDALSGDQPWILWVSAAVCLVLVALLVWFALRRGGGRTGTLLHIEGSKGSGTPTGGSLTVDAKAASQILEEALSRESSIVSVDVGAHRIKKQNVLRITAHARRGVSPVDVRQAIDRAVADWDALLGQETPVVIQIVGGLRTQVSGSTRVA